MREPSANLTKAEAMQWFLGFAVLIGSAITAAVSMHSHKEHVSQATLDAHADSQAAAFGDFKEDFRSALSEIHAELRAIRAINVQMRDGNFGRDRDDVALIGGDGR